MKRAWILLAMVGFAQAQDVRLTTLQIKDEWVGVYMVGSITQPSMSLDDFVVQSSPLIRETTEQLAAEVCGMICSNTSQVGVILTTIRSKAACPIVQVCPKGMVSTGSDVHSHPSAKTYVPSKIDQLFVGKQEMVYTTPDLFSVEDLRHPHAYLVAPQLLLHHDGMSVRVVQTSSSLRATGP